MACEARLTGADTSALVAARGLATRLLEDVFAAEVPLTVRPRVTRGWLSKLLSRLPSGLRFRPAGAALLVGSAWAVAQAAATVSGREVHSLDVERVIDLVTGAPPPESDGGWRGFTRIADAWVSISLGPGEGEVWRRMLAALGSGPRTSDEVAASAQQWGLACLPATHAAPSDIPTTGEDQLPVLSDVGKSLGLSASTALEGVRVIDLGVLVAAPVSGAVLAALGAQVTTVAHPARKDSRWYGGPVLELNLSRQVDRSDFARLCRTADLVVDNFSPRVWNNLGFEPTELGADLHVSMPAFAAGDARRNYRAFGFQTEALFGVGCTPDPAIARPVAAPRAALMDHTVGLVGAVYCLGAIATQRRGRLEVCHSDVAGLVC